MNPQNWQGTLPNGWTGGEAVTKWWRGALVHLYRLRKPCAQCGGEMQIDVTKAALEGKAQNAGLHLKRCGNCRATSKALGTTSRPKLTGQPPAQNAVVVVNAGAPGELEQLRTANATMREELESVYAENRELRARLAQFGDYPPAQPEQQSFPWAKS